MCHTTQATITDHLQAKWIATPMEDTTDERPIAVYTPYSSRIAPTIVSIRIVVDGMIDGSPAVLARGILRYRSRPARERLGPASQQSRQSRSLTLRHVRSARGTEA